MEPQARANQLLPQIASFIGIDLGARIIEEVVFNEGAELRSPIVICAGNNLPRQVRVTSPSAAVKGATGSSAHATQTRRFAGDDERSVWCACFAQSRCLQEFGGPARNELARLFARAVEQYYLVFDSLVNDLHQDLVFERFSEKGESSRVDCGLAH